MKKGNWAIKLGAMSLILAIISSLFSSMTFAKYTTTVIGTDTISVARFGYSAKDGDGLLFTTPSAQDINLFENASTEATGTVASGGGGLYLAPGIFGSFAIELDGSTTEVDLEMVGSTVTASSTGELETHTDAFISYDITYGVGSLNTIAELEYLEGNRETPDEFAAAIESVLEGIILEKNTKGYIMVYWKWVDGEDVADTALGQKWAGGDAPSITITISNKATQIMTASPTYTSNIDAYEFIDTGLLFTLINADTEYAVAKGTNTEETVVLPEVYNGKPVTKIADNGFQGNYSYTEAMTSIVIPDSITSVGDMAFLYARLTSITLPDSVTNIGMAAFYSSKLQDISISEFVVTIGPLPFYLCNDLSNVSVDQNNINYLSEDGVLFNKNKTELIVYPAAKLGTTYTIPQTVTAMGGGAFAQSRNLINITLPDNLNAISDSAFAYCRNLESITIPESVTVIGESAFYQCDSLLTVTILRSASLSVIELINNSSGNNPFFGCSALSSVYVPNDSLDAYAASPWNVFNLETSL